MIPIPGPEKQMKQTNISDNIGTLWSTKSTDFTDNIGRIRVAPRAIITTTSDDDASLELPVAFRFYDNEIWMISGEFIWRNNGTPNDVFDIDNTTDSPDVSDNADMELFNGALYVKSGSILSKYQLSTWTEISDDMFGGDCQMCVYNERLYFTQLSSQIGSIGLADDIANPSGTPNLTDYTLQLADFGLGGSNANHITSIRSSSNRIWIATMDMTSPTSSAGRGGKVFEWDGASNRVNKVYYLESVGALAIIIKDDLPWVIDADGRILKFNGGGFEELTRLPLQPNQYLNRPLGGISERWIHPRGVTIRNDRILLLVNNKLQNLRGSADFDGDINENLPSGVWELDEKEGLRHRYSLSYWKDGESTQTDYGQNRIWQVGALFNAKSVNPGNVNGDLLIGAGYYTSSDTDDTESGVFITDTLQEAPKCGYFVTTKIESQNVEDMWNYVYGIHKKFLTEADRIVLKYRTDDPQPVEYEVDWVSETVFTTTGDVSSYIGSEVEVTQGTGGGQCEQIINVTELSGTYTVTLDKEIVGASGSSIVRFQNWKKAGEAKGRYQDYKKFPISVPGSWIELKCIMYFTGNNELNQLQLINTTNTKSE